MQTQRFQDALKGAFEAEVARLFIAACVNVQDGSKLVTKASEQLAVHILNAAILYDSTLEKLNAKPAVVIASDR